MSIDPQDSWPDRETPELSNPFLADDAEVGGSIDDLAATQEALEAEREAVDAAASERTVPWSKNTAWDGDTSFLDGLYEIGVLVNNCVPVITGYEQLREYGELSEEVQRREIELGVDERVLVYTGLQVLGIVGGERWRVQMDAILTRLEALIEPTELESAALRAAEEIAARVWQEKIREHFAREHPEVGVYTKEEFEEELSNPDTEDAHIRRLQAEQQANLN